MTSHSDKHQTTNISVNIGERNPVKISTTPYTSNQEGKESSIKKIEEIISFNVDSSQIELCHQTVIRETLEDQEMAELSTGGNEV